MSVTRAKIEVTVEKGIAKTANHLMKSRDDFPETNDGKHGALP